MEPAELRDAIPLLADGTDEQLQRLNAHLHPVNTARNGALLRQGAAADGFHLVLSGSVRVHTEADGNGIDLGPGAIIGELALAEARPRSATVTANESTVTLAGDAEAFDLLLSIAGIRERISTEAARRVADLVPPIAVERPLPTGAATSDLPRTLFLRPVLVSDRPVIENAVAHLSDTSVYQRFFTLGPVPSALLEHLVLLDYRNHFAWVLFGTDPLQPIGVGRVARHRGDPATGEFALAIIDRFHGLGLGRLLLDVDIVTAAAMDMSSVSGSVLSENLRMRQLATARGAAWTVDGATMDATIPTDSNLTELDPSLAADIADAVRRIGHVFDAVRLFHGGS